MQAPSTHESFKRQRMCYRHGVGKQPCQDSNSGHFSFKTPFLGTQFWLEYQCTELCSANEVISQCLDFFLLLWPVTRSAANIHSSTVWRPGVVLSGSHGWTPLKTPGTDLWSCLCQLLKAISANQHKVPSPSLFIVLYSSLQFCFRIFSLADSPAFL